MSKQYLHDEVFEINDDLNPILKDVGPYQYLCIDNFYKRPEDIHQILSESWAPNWKLDVHRGNNFKEYYDCRLAFPIQDKTIQYIKNIDLIKTDLGNTYCRTLFTNTFSWINPPSPNIQFLPHEDDTLNVLVYMDKISSGGTAFYENYKWEEHHNEDIDIRHNIEGLKHHIIPSKFNRCVIFNGRIPHGGYIEDHSQYTNGNWRQNLVYFFDHA
jgi:hypothetical protein